MKQQHNKPSQHDRGFRAPPMSEAEYEAFHAQQAQQYGLRARLEESGGTLAVRGLVSPSESVEVELVGGEVRMVTTEELDK